MCNHNKKKHVQMLLLKLLSISQFHFASRLVTRELAQTLHSLVRVSKRVEDNRFVDINDRSCCRTSVTALGHCITSNMFVVQDAALTMHINILISISIYN